MNCSFSVSPQSEAPPRSSHPSKPSVDHSTFPMPGGFSPVEPPPTLTGNQRKPDPFSEIAPALPPSIPSSTLVGTPLSSHGETLPTPTHEQADAHLSSERVSTVQLPPTPMESPTREKNHVASPMSPDTETLNQPLTIDVSLHPLHAILQADTPSSAATSATTDLHTQMPPKARPALAIDLDFNKPLPPTHAATHAHLPPTTENKPEPAQSPVIASTLTPIISSHTPVGTVGTPLNSQARKTPSTPIKPTPVEAPVYPTPPTSPNKREQHPSYDHQHLHALHNTAHEQQHVIASGIPLPLSPVEGPPRPELK